MTVFRVEMGIRFISSGPAGWQLDATEVHQQRDATYACLHGCMSTALSDIACIKLFSLI